MFVSSLLLFACTPGAPDDSAPDDSAGDSADTAEPELSADEAVFEAIRKAAKKDIRASYASGASVAVWRDGSIVFAEGFGTRDPDTEDPVLTTTLFQIGSDTKKLAALVALQQVAAGGLSLDSTVADLVPELVFASDPALAGTITLHELLSHQTGLFDYTPWVDAPDDADLYDRAVGRFADYEYAPGPSGLYWNYCNPNFSLAGLMTQQVDGRMWPDIVEQDLFAPLGLTRSFARKSAVAEDGDYAIGYGYYFPDGYDTFEPLGAAPAYQFGTTSFEHMPDAGFIRPAGLVWSTASDMATLEGFLIDGNEAVLPQNLLRQLTSPQVAVYAGLDRSKAGYGYGLMVNESGWNGYDGYHDVPIWSHGGNTISMTSTTYMLPDQRIAVTVLSNGYGDDFTLTAITALEGLVDLPDTVEAPALFGDPENVEALAGVWSGPSVGSLTLGWDGAALTVDAPDLVAAGHVVGATLEPYSKDIYFLSIDGVDYDLSFYAGEGDAGWLINRQFTFARGVAESSGGTGLLGPDFGAGVGFAALDERLPMRRLMGFAE
ncbi:MAG: class A beta-lactamase-related serine hydrolase [Myxococcales bacterium]|nr:class A beta-lactamase-related serine hydrolase [Myxococcales bacterium]